MNGVSFTALLSPLRCPQCGTDDPLRYRETVAICECGREVEISDSIVRYADASEASKDAAARVRDAQAAGYLRHAKFPIQAYRLRQFLEGLTDDLLRLPALELGCGPGPYTAMLLQRGYRVLAIDYSAASLAINRDANRIHPHEVFFVHADLNAVRLAGNSTKLLVICDVLQHIGSLEARTAFLDKAFAALAPGGCFYLTFFNFNIKNYLKGDLHGAFAGGNIRYERLLYKEVVRALPPDIRVDSITPTNIFHSVLADRLACALPGARYLARMIAIAGKKSPAEAAA